MRRGSSSTGGGEAKVRRGSGSACALCALGAHPTDARHGLHQFQCCGCCGCSSHASGEACECRGMHFACTLHALCMHFAHMQSALCMHFAAGNSFSLAAAAYLYISICMAVAMQGNLPLSEVLNPDPLRTILGFVMLSTIQRCRM